MKTKYHYDFDKEITNGSAGPLRCSCCGRRLTLELECRECDFDLCGVCGELFHVDNLYGGVCRECEDGINQ